VLWVYASNAARFEQSYRDIADRVKIFGRQDPKADIFKLVYDWLCNSKDRWLLVLDNVDDARFLLDVLIAQRDEAANLRSAPKPLRSYIPHSERGSVLITTRNQDAALQLVERRNIINVQPMNDVQASVLFKKKLEKEEDPISIDELATALEYMPLAIVQAAAYIAQKAPRCSVRQYLNEFNRSERRQTNLLNRDGGHLRRDWEASNSVIVTWQISFEHIQQLRPSAADLLSLMSFFDRQGIPADLLRGRATQTDTNGQQEQHANDLQSGDDKDNTSQSSESKDEFEDDVVTLRNFCFIFVEKDDRNFGMHALVQLATRTWLDANNQLEQWRREFVALMAREFPSGSFENWTRCQVLLPHVTPIFEKKPAEEGLLWDWAQVLSSAAWYLSVKGQYGEAESVAKKAVKTRERVLGKDDLSTLTSVHNLASALWYQGKYEAADAMSRRALEGREKALGKEHPLTLTSVNNLALVLQDQGKYEAAETMIRRALEGTEKVLGNEHPSTLTSVSNLARVLQSQGKYEAAEAMNWRALEECEKTLGKEHPLTLTSVNNLALVLQDQGKYEAAEAMSRRALEGIEKTLGKEHPDTLTSLNNLARVLQSQGKYEAAEAMNRRALERFEKILGTEHPSTLRSISNLALVLQYQGKYEAAEATNRRALERIEKTLGTEHPLTLSSISNLALVLQYQGKYEAAEAMNRRALEGREKALGKEHPDTLTSVNNLAAALQNQGKYEAAEVMNRRVLEGKEKALGKEHLDTLTSVNNLAAVLRYQEKYEVAEEMIQRALDGYEKVLGKEHPLTLTSVNNLAAVLQDQGKYEAAEAMNRRALERREKVLGKEHPDTLTSVYCLAYLLHRWGRYEEAMLLYKRASSGYTTTLGLDHPTTRTCLDDQLSLEQLLHRQATDHSRHEAVDDSTHPPGPGSLESSLPRPEPLPKKHWWQKVKKKIRKA